MAKFIGCKRELEILQGLTLKQIENNELTSLKN